MAATKLSTPNWSTLVDLREELREHRQEGIFSLEGRGGSGGSIVKKSRKQKIFAEKKTGVNNQK